MATAQAMLAAGDTCPAFKTTAAVTDREVSPQALAGRRAVLVLHGPRTSEAPKLVGKAVRAVHKSADEVVVANVVNLKSMAGLWKKVADAQVKATYEKMAGKLGDDAPDYVVICTDYENAVATAFGFADTNQKAAVVVLEDDGTVIGSTDEGDLAEQALGWLS